MATRANTGGASASIGIPASSRYHGAASYQATTAGGAVVTALVVPAGRSPLPIGYHPRAVGDRLDLLAVQYLNAPTGFWRLCDTNNSMVPGALEQRALIGIPAMGT
jgi:hypothetical protein